MNTLLVTMLVMEGVIAVGFMVSPGSLLGPLGLVLDDVSTTAFRILGSALFAFPALLWSAWKSTGAEIKKVAVRTLVVYFLLSLVFLVVAQLAGQMNAMGWILIALHLGFALWGIILLARKASVA
jgi:hypothetical protein